MTFALFIKLHPTSPHSNNNHFTMIPINWNLHFDHSSYSTHVSCNGWSYYDAPNIIFADTTSTDSSCLQSNRNNKERINKWVMRFNYLICITSHYIFENENGLITNDPIVLSDVLYRFSLFMVWFVTFELLLVLYIVAVQKHVNNILCE